MNNQSARYPTSDGEALFECRNVGIDFGLPSLQLFGLSAFVVCTMHARLVKGVRVGLGAEQEALSGFRF